MQKLFDQKPQIFQACSIPTFHLEYNEETYKSEKDDERLTRSKLGDERVKQIDHR